MRPGCRRPLCEHVLGRDVEHADLGRHDDEAVLGDDVARRAQAVAVEHRADHRAVGERDRRRAVPRLHQAGVVLVEGALRRRSCSRASATPRGSSSSRRAAASGRCAPAARARCRTSPSRCRSASMIGKIFSMSSPNSGDANIALARVHPVDVAAQRVDLAVVRDEAVRVGAIPRRERVGAEALVHQRERAREVGIGQVAVELPGSARAAAGPCRRWCATRGSGRRSDSRVAQAGLADQRARRACG